MQSVSAVSKVSNNNVALLNRETQTIDLYSQGTNSIEKTIDLPCYAMDFDYSDGKYFLFDFDKISVIDDNGLLVQTLPYRIPKGEAFALEKRIAIIWTMCPIML
jgi:hypothetical protein